MHVLLYALFLELVSQRRREYKDIRDLASIGNGQ